jgi:hypothetical protein
MVHGHTFHFIDLPELQSHSSGTAEKNISVKALSSQSILDDYTLKRPWVPLSGREGQYFAKNPFEEADAHFSWGLEIKDVLTLLWLPEEQTIAYLKGAHFTAQKLQFWIFHTFFPLVLELNRSYQFLHVGAVETRGKTILFSAPSFGGKSTLTDYFIKQGATLISDDALGIERKKEDYCAIPAYPFHRPYREPEVLGHKVERFALEAKKIDAVFLLQKADANAKISIQEVRGIEKFKAFHHSVFIEFPFRKEERFRFFGEMAQKVPVYRINIPWDLKRLNEVHQAILSLS